MPKNFSGNSCRAGWLAFQRYLPLSPRQTTQPVIISSLVDSFSFLSHLWLTQTRLLGQCFPYQAGKLILRDAAKIISHGQNGGQIIDSFYTLSFFQVAEGSVHGSLLLHVTFKITLWGRITWLVQGLHWLQHTEYYSTLPKMWLRVTVGEIRKQNSHWSNVHHHSWGKPGSDTIPF